MSSPDRIDNGPPRIRFPLLTKRLSIKSIWVEEKWPSRPLELSVGSSAMA